MKKGLIYSLFVTALVVLFSFNSGGFADNSTIEEISVSPQQDVNQGQTVFIEIRTSRAISEPVFKFKNKSYKIFKTAENEYTGLLGINTLEKPGKYPISITDKTGNLNETSYITVVKKDHPKQYITVTKGMAGLKATAYELRQVGRAKYTLTVDKMRKDPPYNSPANGCINSTFGVRRYYNGEFSGNYHKGIDIKAPTGEPVRSITDGKVIFAENADKFRLHGGSVAVDHGQGLVSLYIHLSKIDVKAGDIVKADQKVGEVGMTGFATGPHLHWGLYVNGTPVDPMQEWIKPVSLCK